MSNMARDYSKTGRWVTVVAKIVAKITIMRLCSTLLQGCV